MKSTELLSITVYFLFYSIVCPAQSKNDTLADSLATYNFSLSPREMQKDLQVFRDIREQVNSGLYSYRTKEEIDSIYSWAFEKAKIPMPVMDFFKVVLQLTDFENSLHNYTEPGSSLMEYLKRQKIYFPYYLVYIEGKMIFGGLHPILPPGAQILSVNGIESIKLMQSFYRYFPVDGHSNSYKLSSSVEKIFEWRYFMEYGLSEEFVVTYTAPGSEHNKTIVLQSVS